MFRRVLMLLQINERMNSLMVEEGWEVLDVPLPEMPRKKRNQRRFWNPTGLNKLIIVWLAQSRNGSNVGF